MVLSGAVIVQRHFQTFVGVLVVHVVDDVHGTHVHPREPVHHLFEAHQDVVEVEDVPCHRGEGRRDLFAAHLISAAVDRIEQALGEVGASAKELHLLAHDHWRHAAGDGAVVTQGAAHQLVALELDRTRVDGDLRGKPAEAVGHPRRVPDREVRLGRGPEIVERLQQAETGLCDERAAVVAHCADRLGHPRRVACEQFVVVGCPQESDDTQLDHEVVDDLLRLLLVERPGGEITCEVDIEKGGGSAERHRRAVLFLHSGEVSEVQPVPLPSPCRPGR